MKIIKNRNQKRKALKHFNNQLKLNNKKPISLQEFEEMERFDKAYSMELMRTKQRSKTAKMILLLAGIITVLIALIAGENYIIGLINDLR